jgi:hypothetical protein
MNRRRIAFLALVAALAIVVGSAVVTGQIANSGCSADHLPDKIGIYSRTDTELTSVDPMPLASGVRPSLPEVVLELPGDGTCPVLSSGPMRIWLKVAPNRYVMYTRPGGP